MANDVALLEAMLSSSRIVTADGAAVLPDVLPITLKFAIFAIFANETALLAIVTAPALVMVTSPLNEAAVNPSPSPIKMLVSDN